ncbi:MAG: threonine synthase [Bacteroidetes bacterium]|nr:threonine synthase [Bacteroidota bacterium]
MPAPILFYSTNRKATPVPFSQALLKGIAPDGGLFMPERIPCIETATLEKYAELPYPEIAFDISRRFLQGQIPDTELMRIVRDSYNYPVPLENVTGRKFVMRLDQGPTASFKDFAARMMGRLMQYYLHLENRKLLILTATSGDTGSAVANAFYGLNNVQTVILFPEAEVTDRQRKQMTTLGKNVHVLALDAKFDDCQALVKRAFADPSLDSLSLSSANSINIGRLIPQIVYYFYAYSRLSVSTGEPIIFSVPSGNFGDMMGGVLAMKMGLPVKKFIIATNENDEFPKYLASGMYDKIEPSRNCISSAMNVGHPSNLARLVDLYGGFMDEKGNIAEPAEMRSMRKEIWSASITDEQTRETIRNTYDEYGVLLEPHGAVGWAGLMKYLEEDPSINADQLCVSLETAHPAKFPQEILNILNVDPELPESLKGLEGKAEQFEEIPNDFEDFKNYLIENFK